MVRPQGMHGTYCGMPKGICQAEAVSVKKIKLVALAVVEYVAVLLLYAVPQQKTKQTSIVDL